MVGVCVIKTCLKWDRRMHTFPHPERNRALLKKWLEVCGNEELYNVPPMTVYKNRRVCHKHFDKDQFGPNDRLLRTAYPTLNLPPMVQDAAVTERTESHGRPVPGSSTQAEGQLFLFENHLEIPNTDTNPLMKFHYIWLRDHCRCSECYNHKTQQRISDILKIPFNIKPANCQHNEEKIEITWDDGHKTEFSIPWLQNLTTSRKKRLNTIQYWNNTDVKTLDTHISCKEYFGKEDGLKRLLQSILKYGFGFVTDVEPTLEATEAVVRFMAPVKRTFFGEMWEVTNDLSHDDTAYSTVALGAHNDNTYFTEASGLQIFHMLEHEGTGGETLLVDGFNAANKLREEDSEAFHTLCNSPIESEYIEKGVHYSTIEPVVKLHPVTKNLFQIRYNIYDRAPLNTIDHDGIIEFYEAYQKLGKELNDPKNQWCLKLNPGSVIFIDNWRVLHGRASYSGKRRLSGCYVSRSDWLSTAKYLGLPLY